MSEELEPVNSSWLVISDVTRAVDSGKSLNTLGMRQATRSCCIIFCTLWFGPIGPFVFLGPCCRRLPAWRGLGPAPGLRNASDVLPPGSAVFVSVPGNKAPSEEEATAQGGSLLGRQRLVLCHRSDKPGLCAGPGSVLWEGNGTKPCHSRSGCR